MKSTYKAKPKFKLPLTPVKELTPELEASLNEVLTMSIDEFEQLPNAKVHETTDGPAIFFDNNADVLAVGHIDWVQFNKYYTLNNPIIERCPQLDDRLGVWVVLHLLPALYPGLKYDILLCDSEEIGRSTGQHYPFPEGKQYNWAFEFDRAGTDTVLYEYDCKEWRQQAANISQVGYGSYSDISYLEDLGCKMMNVGVGYHKQHTADCYADLRETFEMVHSFAAWAEGQMEVAYPHTKEEKEWGNGWKNNGYGSYSYYYDRTHGDDNGDDHDTIVIDDEFTRCGLCDMQTDQHAVCSDCQDWLCYSQNGATNADISTY